MPRRAPLRPGIVGDHWVCAGGELLQLLTTTTQCTAKESRLLLLLVMQGTHGGLLPQLTKLSVLN